MIAVSAAYVGYQIGVGVYDWAAGKGQLLFPNGQSGNPQDIVDKYKGNVFVNGMLNDQATAQAISDANNIPVFWNPSHGPIADFTESFLQKFTGTSSLDRQFASMLQSIQGPVKILAHSQGTIITANALSHLGNSPLASGSTVKFMAPAITQARAALSTNIAGILSQNVTYTSNWFDVINVVGPNMNPLKFASGVVGGLTSGAKYHALSLYGLKGA